MPRAVRLFLCVILSIAACTPQDTPSAAPSERPDASATPVADASAAVPSQAPATTEQPSAPPGGASAADLIEQDVAAGRLDASTAILYRVYAVFGDPRLPEPYASAPAGEDRWALAAAQDGLDDLPGPIADELRPYLVRPTDPSSVFYDISAPSTGDGPAAVLAAYRPAGPTAIPAQAPAPVTCNRITGWGYATGVARFKVWGECGNPTDDASIALLVAIVEELWDAEAAYLGRQALPDEGSPDPDEWLDDQGGDSRIDIYLINPCVIRGGRCRGLAPGTLAASINSPPRAVVKGVGVKSAFVLVPRSAMSGNMMRLRSTIAHELFHVFQNAMNVDGTKDARDWHWFVEASAKWAEWAFVPGAASLEVAPWFVRSQDTPYPLPSTAEGNEYASFSWPLYMEQEAGTDAVARAWQAIEGKTDVEAVNRAIDGVLSFRERFHDFAVRSWNEALGAGQPLEPLLPLPPTGASRPKPAGPHRHPDETLLPSPPGDLVHEFSEDIPGLDASYVHLQVDPDVGQLIVDFTGLFPPAAQDRDALVKVRDKGWEYRELEPGPTTWCMDDPDNDIEELIVVISNHEWDTTTVEGDWTIQSPLEPCLSYQIHIEWVDTYNNVDDAFVFDGWADTIDRDLSTSEAIVLTGTGVLSGERPGWAGCNPGLGFTPSGIGEAEFVATIIGEEVTIGGYEGLESTFFGVGTQPFTLDRRGGTVTRSGTSVSGDLCSHRWSGTLTATVRVRPPGP